MLVFCGISHHFSSRDEIYNIYSIAFLSVFEGFFFFLVSSLYLSCSCKYMLSVLGDFYGLHIGVTLFYEIVVDSIGYSRDNLGCILGSYFKSAFSAGGYGSGDFGVGSEFGGDGSTICG